VVNPSTDSVAHYYNFELVATKYTATTLTVKWTMPHYDSSLNTTITMFDFDADGSTEIVYRDERSIRIINGAGSQPVIRVETCNHSGTSADHPVIADVDGDNQAEIIVVGRVYITDDPDDIDHKYFYNSTNTDVDYRVETVHNGGAWHGANGWRGVLSVYKSDKPVEFPWATARKVWNQWYYHPVIVDDNMTIPAPVSYATATSGTPAGNNQYKTVGKRYPANNNQPYNNFFQQPTYVVQSTGEPLWPTPDAKIENVSNTYFADGDSLVIEFDFINSGNSTMFPAAAAYKNITASSQRNCTNLLEGRRWEQYTLAPGARRNNLQMVVHNYSSFAPINLVHLEVNDDGTTCGQAQTAANDYNHIFRECHYDNNPSPTQVIINTKPDSTNTKVNTAVLTHPFDNDLTGGATVVPTIPNSGLPKNGSAVVDAADSVILYIPNPDFVGHDTIRYLLTASDTVSAWGIIYLNVYPEAHNDVGQTSYRDTVALNLTANDQIGGKTPDANLTVPAGGNPTHGSLTDISKSGVKYVPANNFAGRDSFQYIVIIEGLADTAWVTVDVYPDANPDVLKTTPSQPATINVGANDGVGTVNPATYSKTGGPSHGTATISSSGQLNYTPDPGFCGVDTVWYSVTVDGLTSTSYTVVNVTPDARDDNVNTDSGQPVHINELKNDSVGTGNPNPITVDFPVAGGGPDHGTAVQNTDKSITYTPDPGFVGHDTITYVTIVDGLRDTAIIVINVYPVAENDNAETVPGVAVTTNVTNNDQLGGKTPDVALVVPTTGQPQHGTAGAAGGTSKTDVTYTPDAGFCGRDSFQYIVTIEGMPDTAWVFVDVNPNAKDDHLITDGCNPTCNSYPINVLANDSTGDGSVNPIEDLIVPVQPPHGTVTVNPTDSTITYTPDPGFVGHDTIMYIVIVDGLPDTAYVYVDVYPVANPDPESETPTVNTVPGETTVVDVTNNDILGGKTPDTNLEVPTGGDPIHGQLSDTTKTGFTYTPDDGYCGRDSFQYIVTVEGLPDTAWVYVNTYPEPFPDVVTTQPGDGPTTIDIAQNDNTGDGSVHTPDYDGPTSGPTYGTATITDDGILTYEPDPIFVGHDTIWYEVTVDGLTSTTYVVVENRPIANPDEAITGKGQPIDHITAVDVLANDSVGYNPDDATVTIPINDTPGGGHAEVDPDNNKVLYWPDPNFVGRDTITYIVTVDGLSDTTILVVRVNPDAIDDHLQTRSEEPITIDVVKNDDLGYDANGNPNTADNVETNITGGEPKHGTVVVNADNTITYTPDDDFVGRDSFLYVVYVDCLPLDIDPCLTDTAWVYIDVRPYAVDDKVETTTNNPAGPLNVIDNDLLGKDENGNPNKPDKYLDIQYPPHDGTITEVTDSGFVYNPNEGFVGLDTVYYIVTVDGLVDTAMVVIAVLPDTQPDGDPNSDPDAPDLPDSEPYNFDPLDEEIRNYEFPPSEIYWMLGCWNSITIPIINNDEYGKDSPYQNTIGNIWVETPPNYGSAYVTGEKIQYVLDQTKITGSVKDSLQYALEVNGQINYAWVYIDIYVPKPFTVAGLSTDMAEPQYMCGGGTLLGTQVTLTVNFDYSQYEPTRLYYKWYHTDSQGNTELLDLTRDSVYTFTYFSPDGQGEYYCVVSNGCDEQQTTEGIDFRDNPYRICQEWDDVIYFCTDEEPISNFVEYQWYKNGDMIQTDGFDRYLAAIEGLDGEYKVRAYRANGTYVETCPVEVVSSRQSVNYDVSLAPNPASSGSTFKVIINIPNFKYSTANIQIFSGTGVTLSITPVAGQTTTVAAPSQKGSYLVRIAPENGDFIVRKLIIK